MTHAEFLALFPSDEACLEYLKERHYGAGTACPGCGRQSRFHRIRGRSAYSCQFCGTHVYPTAGTIFHKSRTPLRLWFWAIFLIASTRSTISARELERELGVTYKTAQRMLTQIGSLLPVADHPSEHTSQVAAAVAAEPQPEPRAPEPGPRPAVWHGRRRRS